MSDRDVELFTAAVRLPVERREAFLTEACASDPALRAHIESLLAAHERTVAGFEVGEAEEAVAAVDDRGRGDLRSGDLVGRYRLIREIGEGGCGVVFLAEQEVPFRRQVALKVIKPGMDSRSVISRFEAERQALALMDHPGIAKIFDAGTTESGRPFFAMEFIRGMRITEYCERSHPTIEQRLELLILVAQAVQHAHQKGVIHRDIKPSNILVTVCDDDRPVPVIIDFGIAKAVSPRGLGEHTMFTAVDIVVGTPAYMSPEQASLTGGDVDTRADIYSLGALLYELLTGAPPFDGAELLKAGFDGARRIIRERDPVRPSVRLRALPREKRDEIVRQRGTDASALLRALAGDLDWITMKALEKDPGRRYDTANDLAADVRRYLAHDTVLARPPSRFYRLRKTVARNRLVFAGVGVLGLVLVVSLAVVARALARERHARRAVDAALLVAREEKATAQAEVAKSEQVVKFLEDMLQGVGPSVALGRDTTMLRDILDTAATRLAGELRDQPAVRAELQGRIAMVYRDLGFYAQAEALGRTVLATYRELPGDHRREAARALSGIGDNLLDQNRLAEAEVILREALELRRSLPESRPEELMATLLSLSSVRYRQTDFQTAGELLRESLAIGERSLDEHDKAMITMLNALSLVLLAEHRYAEVEPLQRRVLAASRASLPAPHPSIAQVLYNLGETLYRAGKLEAAEDARREALAMRRELFSDDHPELGDSLSGLGTVLLARGKPDEAETCLREALTIYGKTVGADHPKSTYTQQVLADLMIDQGRADDAIALMENVLARIKLKAGREQYVASALISLGRALELAGRDEEAEAHLRESLQLVPDERGRGVRVAFASAVALGQLQHRRGKLSEAELTLRQAVDLQDRALVAGHPDRATLRAAMRSVLEAAGKFEEAQAWGETEAIVAAGSETSGGGQP